MYQGLIINSLGSKPILRLQLNSRLLQTKCNMTPPPPSATHSLLSPLLTDSHSPHPLRHLRTTSGTLSPPCAASYSRRCYRWRKRWRSTRDSALTTQEEEQRLCSREHVWGGSAQGIGREGRRKRKRRERKGGGGVEGEEGEGGRGRRREEEGGKEDLSDILVRSEERSVWKECDTGCRSGC